MFTVQSDLQVRKTARRIAVVVDLPDYQHTPGADDPALNDVIEQIARELMRDSDLLIIRVYLDAGAVAYSGWIAQATAKKDSPISIRTDNDPDARRAIFEAFH